MSNNIKNAQLPPETENITGVLVTGSSSDIGKELCGRLRSRAVTVLGTYNTNRPANSDVVLPTEGMDLAVDADLDRLRAFAEQHFHGPFALVHCVGDFWDHLPIHACPLESARRMIQSHYLTLYGVLNRLLPLMADLGGGRVLAISCTSTRFSYPDMAAFTSAKAAVEMLIKCVANEWAPHGVVANAVAMSTVATAKVLNSPSKPMSSQESYVTPAEAAELLEQLLWSPSPYLSGNVIRPLKYSRTFYNTGYFQRNPPALAERKDELHHVAEALQGIESPASYSEE